jgi:crotonobetainyl-CoA:carnitine CoA-transferase CaiB-like acyl-CoA transferase
LGGLSSLVGYAGGAPTGMNIRYADSTFGTAAAYASLIALLHRRRTGVGQFVDVSAVESMSSMIGDTLMDFALNGTIAACDGNHHAEMAPHGAYPCANGEWISIAVASDEQWGALADVMGTPELAAHPSFAGCVERVANATALDRLVSQWSVQWDAAELCAALQQRDIAATKSQSSLDLVSDPHLWGRGFFTQVTDQAQHTRTILGPAWKMSRPALVTAAAPRLGEHNAYVLGSILGLSTDEQQQLTDAGITR